MLRSVALDCKESGSMIDSIVPQTTSKFNEQLSALKVNSHHESFQQMLQQQQESKTKLKLKQTSAESTLKKLSKVRTQQDALVLHKIGMSPPEHIISPNLPTIKQSSSRHAADGMIKLSEHSHGDDDLSPQRNYFKSNRKHLSTNRLGGH